MVGTAAGWATGRWLRYRRMWPTLNWTLFSVGLAYVVAVLIGVAPYGRAELHDLIGPAQDGWAYWAAPFGDPYASTIMGQPGAYLYSPAFLQAIAPLKLLPWELFVTIWAAMHVGAVIWMRVPWMLAFPGVIDDVVRGNVNTFIALTLVLAMRYPAAWAFPILTKATPVVALGFHAVRRDWRALIWAVGSTAAVIALSLVAGAEHWFAWVSSLSANAEVVPNVQVLAIPLVVRLPVALTVAAVAARWRWLLPVAVMLSLPNLTPSSLAVLAAIPALAAPDLVRHRPNEQSAP